MENMTANLSLKLSDSIDNKNVDIQKCANSNDTLAVTPVNGYNTNFPSASSSISMMGNEYFPNINHENSDSENNICHAGNGRDKGRYVVSA